MVCGNSVQLFHVLQLCLYVTTSYGRNESATADYVKFTCTQTPSGMTLRINSSRRNFTLALTDTRVVNEGARHTATAATDGATQSHTHMLPSKETHRWLHGTLLDEVVGSHLNASYASSWARLSWSRLTTNTTAVMHTAACNTNDGIIYGAIHSAQDGGWVIEPTHDRRASKLVPGAMAHHSEQTVPDHVSLDSSIPLFGVLPHSGPCMRASLVQVQYRGAPCCLLVSKRASKAGVATASTSHIITGVLFCQNGAKIWSVTFG